MALESATYINGLVASNPPSTDPLAQADDHIRLLKSTIKATFPNITGPVTATQTVLNNPFPIGGIIMWSGAIDALPAGWALCNGGTYTRTDGGGNITAPDLRDRFIVGAGSSYAVGATGGSNSATTSSAGSHAHGGATAAHALSISEMPPHNHGGVTSTAGEHSHTVSDFRSTDNFDNQAGGLGNPIGSGTRSTSAAGNHAHGIPVEGSGGGHAHGISSDGAHSHTVDTRSPYYALAFIIKI